jgi:thymidine phosphorylase
MSKKISAGSKYILIDIPYGAGAKVKSFISAKKLGNKFKFLAKNFKLKIKVVYTSGSQPVGNGFGPVLEMLDVLKILKNEVGLPKDLKDKSLFLSAELMKLCGIRDSVNKANEILSSGKAYEKFLEIVNAQNGKNNAERRIRKLKLAKFSRKIKSKSDGRITKISNEKINGLCRILGTPETIGAGTYLHKHLGNVKNGELIMTLYSESRKKMREAVKFIKEFKPVVVR